MSFAAAYILENEEMAANATVEVMADAILKVMKANKGLCGTFDLLRELKRTGHSYDYDEIIANWEAANHRAMVKAKQAKTRK